MLMYHQEKKSSQANTIKFPQGKGGVKNMISTEKKKKINERCKALEKEFEKKIQERKSAREKVLLL